MRLLKEVKNLLNNKGYMTSVKINGTLNCVTITSAYSQYLFNRLRVLGSEVSLDVANCSINVYDEPGKFFKLLKKV